MHAATYVGTGHPARLHNYRGTRMDVLVTGYCRGGIPPQARLQYYTRIQLLPGVDTSACNLQAQGPGSRSGVSLSSCVSNSYTTK